MSGRKGLRIKIENALHFMKMVRDTRSHTHAIIREFLTQCFGVSGKLDWTREKNKLHSQSIIASIHKCGGQMQWAIIANNER